MFPIQSGCDKALFRRYEITTDAASADVVLINTCSVREKAEQKLLRKLAGSAKNMAATGYRRDGLRGTARGRYSL